jgi:hypothetical protein
MFRRRSRFAGRGEAALLVVLSRDGCDAPGVGHLTKACAQRDMSAPVAA